MLTFFRRIRKGLLKSDVTNKNNIHLRSSKGVVGRYFLYAIGEITLVVIGILIALWINNLNQERLNQEQFESILVKIQNDIITNTGYSKRLINIYIGIDSVKNKVFNNQISYDKLNNDELKEIVKISLNWMNFRTQTSGYDELMENI